jgi:hypothetical protein
MSRLLGLLAPASQTCAHTSWALQDGKKPLPSWTSVLCTHHWKSSSFHSGLTLIRCWSDSDAEVGSPAVVDHNVPHVLRRPLILPWFIIFIITLHVARESELSRFARVTAVLSGNIFFVYLHTFSLSTAIWRLSSSLLGTSSNLPS